MLQIFNWDFCLKLFNLVRSFKTSLTLVLPLYTEGEISFKIHAATLTLGGRNLYSVWQKEDKTPWVCIHPHKQYFVNAILHFGTTFHTVTD